MAGSSRDGRGTGHRGAIRAVGRTVRRFAVAEGGATAIEYGLIASLVALGIVALLNSFAASLSGFFRNVASAMRQS